MTEPFKEGEYVMLGAGCLARVGKLTDRGFRFNCENGGWDGHYDVEAKSLAIDEGSIHSGVRVMSRRQPPAGMRHYNKIIPYMMELVP